MVNSVMEDRPRVRRHLGLLEAEFQVNMVAPRLVRANLVMAHYLTLFSLAAVLGSSSLGAGIHHATAHLGP